MNSTRKNSSAISVLALRSQSSSRLLKLRASGLAFNTTDDRKDFQTLYDQSLHLYGKFSAALLSVPLADLGKPSGGHFHYPIDKRRTRAHTEAMRKAECHLDTFWRHVDEQVTIKDSDLRAFGLSFFGERKLERTPEWVEPIEIDNSVTTEIPYVSFGQMNIDEKNIDEKTQRPSAVKETVKTKTRGVARPPPSAIAARQMPTRQPSTEQTIQVSRRAFKVFSVLFYTPSSQSETPGEVPWSDFLHAMASAGFTIEKLYGSVWQLTPTKLDVEASIQFHEPHPQGKIPFLVARRHGRRLHRSYGWTS